MTKLVFDNIADRRYETGVENVALYVVADNGEYGKGVAWNGVTKVNETPEGGEITPLYADNIKYLSLVSAVNMKFSLECYTYPDEWAVCDGSALTPEKMLVGQQSRKSFGLVYITRIGTEANPDAGEKLHILYGCKASPAERSYETINKDPNAITFSYSGECTPVPVTGYKPTALVTIDSTLVDAGKYKKVKDALYGSEQTEPKLLLPDDVTKLLKGM